MIKEMTSMYIKKQIRKKATRSDSYESSSL